MSISSKKPITKLSIALLSSLFSGEMSYIHGSAALSGGAGTVPEVGTDYHADALGIAVQSLKASSAKELASKIREYSPLAEAVRGKDITVILGNTGAGKSTLINILANNALVLNRSGAIELAAGAAGLAMGAGAASVTSYPQSITSTSLGVIFDMPGFNDTGGVTKDLLNAGLMKSILERAKTVKAVLVVSEAELEVKRTMEFDSVMKHIGMFPKEFLETSLCMIINKVSPENIRDGKIDRDWLLHLGLLSSDSESGALLNRLLVADKISIMPKAGETYTIERIQTEFKASLEHQLSHVAGTRPSSLHMGMTLSPVVSSDLEKYFALVFFDTLKTLKETEWRRGITTTSILGSDIGVYKRQLLEQVEKIEDIKILKPLGEDQYRRIISEFFEADGIFDATFNIFVSELKLKEAQKKIAEANEEKRLAQEAMQQAIAEKNAAQVEAAQMRIDAAGAGLIVAQGDGDEANAEFLFILEMWERIITRVLDALVDRVIRGAGIL